LHRKIIRGYSENLCYILYRLANLQSEVSGYTAASMRKTL